MKEEKPNPLRGKL